MKAKRIKNQSRVPIEVIMNENEMKTSFRHVVLAPRNSIMVPYYSITDQVLELARRKQIEIIDVN